MRSTTGTPPRTQSRAAAPSSAAASEISSGNLLGASYGCFPGNGDLVVASPSSWLLTGTGLQRGDQLTGAMGPEFDAVQPSQRPARPLEVVLHSPVRCGQYRYADATYYSTKSGAAVFNAGAMNWVQALDGRSGHHTETRIQQITTTLLRAFAHRGAGHTHPARDTAATYYPALRR